MLTNVQIEDLAQRMEIPLEFVGFKSELPTKLKTNKCYIINLDDEVDEGTGILSSGTHWVSFVVMKYPNEKTEAIYFDSYGIGPPEIVKQRVKDNFKIGLPFNEKDIQSLMNEACGWYCLAFCHFIFAYENRTKNLYWDVEAFLSLFEDLNKSIDFKKNEYILKMFFQPKDPKLRKPIEVIADTDRITDGCTQQIDPSKLPEEGTAFDSIQKVAVEIK